MGAVIRQSAFVGFVTDRLNSDGRQFPLDGRNDLRIGRLNRGAKAGLEVAVAADQVFVEIPTRGFQRTFDRRPFVERVGVTALDRYLVGQREGDVVLLVRGLADFDNAARLLAAEIGKTA